MYLKPKKKLTKLG